MTSIEVSALPQPRSGSSHPILHVYFRPGQSSPLDDPVSKPPSADNPTRQALDATYILPLGPSHLTAQSPNNTLPSPRKTKPLPPIYLISFQSLQSTQTTLYVHKSSFNKNPIAAAAAAAAEEEEEEVVVVN
ncbi:hypothetical protein KXW37_001910 [Aspergillus fumigatus]|nr:hypothetical protein KXW37_001910 [Aspergillus fumigatus]